MLIHAIEQNFLQIQQQYALTAAETGLLVYLINVFRKYSFTTIQLWLTDKQVCEEMDITRRKLRAARRHLIRCKLLHIDLQKGNRSGAFYRLATGNIKKAAHKCTIKQSPDSVYLEDVLPEKKEDGLYYSSYGREYHKQVQDQHPIAPEAIEPSSLKEVIEYFIEKGYLNPEREGKKFWEMLYWQRRPELPWQNSAALWNERSIEYQKNYPSATRQGSSICRRNMFADNQRPGV